MAWRVELSGSDTDFEYLAALSGSDRVVRDDSGIWYLESASFDVLTDPTEVLPAAELVLQRVNGAFSVRFPHFGPVEATGQIAEGGRRHAVVRPETVTIRVLVEQPTVSVDGASGPDRPSLQQQLIAAAASDTDVHDALAILSKGDLDWVDLYKVFEIVREGVEDMKAMGVTRREQSRFTHTANSPDAIGSAARHAIQRGNPPTDPMTLGEGRRFICRLLEAWVASDHVDES